MRCVRSRYFIFQFYIRRQVHVQTQVENGKQTLVLFFAHFIASLFLIFKSILLEVYLSHGVMCLYANLPIYIYKILLYKKEKW